MTLAMPELKIPSEKKAVKLAPRGKTRTSQDPTLFGHPTGLVTLFFAPGSRRLGRATGDR